jgi:hypothetical protein
MVNFSLILPLLRFVNVQAFLDVPKSTVTFPRKIIQIATGEVLHYNHTLYALCEDGTLWSKTITFHSGKKWTPLLNKSS